MGRGEKGGGARALGSRDVSLSRVARGCLLTLVDARHCALRYTYWGLRHMAQHTLFPSPLRSSLASLLSFLRILRSLRSLARHHHIAPAMIAAPNLPATRAHKSQITHGHLNSFHLTCA